MAQKCRWALWAAIAGAFLAGVLVGALVFRPEPEKVAPLRQGEFSRALMERLPDRLGELGLWPELIRETGEGARVRVPGDLSPLVVNLEVTRLVEELGGRVFRAVEEEDGRVRIEVGPKEGATDLILLVPTPEVCRRAGWIALIVDDFGYQDDELVRGFCELPREVAFSVLPFQKRTRRIAEKLYESGHEVLLHLPMEPYGLGKADPGKGAIYVRMSEEEISRRVLEALEEVPGAVGVNNHMGSRATEDWRVMRAVLRVLKRKGLFFVDSRTSAHSVGYRVAMELGIRAAERAKFLDVVDDQEAIARALWELADMAAEEGVVVGVGHARPHTLEVLRRELPKLERRGFSLVPVSEVVSATQVARGR